MCIHSVELKHWVMIMAFGFQSHQYAQDSQLTNTAISKWVDSWPSDGMLGSPMNKSHLAQESYAGELDTMRQRSAQLTHLIDVIPAGVVIIDGDGIVTQINQKALDLLDEPLLGMPWCDIIARAFKPREDDWHEVSLHDGRRVKLEITALESQPGQLILITDLTETRLMQDKISQMQRLSSLGKMVSSLAHQIRTPLSAAMLYGANLANDNLSDDARDSFQRKMMQRLHDLEHQVNDMLLFAKSGGKQVVEQIDINHLITQAVDQLTPQLEQSSAKVLTNLCDAQEYIVGNAQALTGAIQNLIQNSLQAKGKEAEVAIQTYARNQELFISIKDNGPGICQSKAKTIFEPFYTSKPQGTGLGLAVVKSVISSHRGEITLLSHTGEGAHFAIRLPLNKTQNGLTDPDTIPPEQAVIQVEETAND